MRLIYCMAFFIFITSSSYSQYVYEDEAISEAYNWLAEGEYTFEILEKDIPPSLQKIITQYQESITKNRIWLQNYKLKYDDVKPLPYDENFGITEAEYNLMNSEFPKLKMKGVAKKAIQVSKTSENIKFAGSKDFKFLDAIVIDKTANTVLLDNKKAQYEGQVYEETSVYGKYVGYKWKYEVGDYQAMKELQKPDYYSVSVTIGKTMPDNKMLIIIDVLRVEKLITKVNNTLSGYLLKKS